MKKFMGVPSILLEQVKLKGEGGGGGGVALWEQ